MDVEQRVTFIRIPKNASTSLYSFFGLANTVRNECLSGDNPRHLNIFESSHQSISELEYNLGSWILEKPVLAVVRNPYERLVSMYFFARKYDLGKIYSIDTSSFSAFAHGFHGHSVDDNFFHAWSQRKFIDHPASDSFSVVRFEDLHAGVAEFIDGRGLSDVFSAADIEKLNSTEHDHYSHYYQDETIGLVNDMWGGDLDFFSYSFDDQRV